MTSHFRGYKEDQSFPLRSSLLGTPPSRTDALFQQSRTCEEAQHCFAPRDKHPARKFIFEIAGRQMDHARASESVFSTVGTGVTVSPNRIKYSRQSKRAAIGAQPGTPRTADDETATISRQQPLGARKKYTSDKAATVTYIPTPLERKWPHTRVPAYKHTIV